MRKLFRIVLGMMIAISISIMIPILSIAGSITTKKQTTRDIAIVFDNSGSMYLKGKKDWCQATYAIEVFSRMMNEGDTLYVFPMNEIEVGGKSYTWNNPLKIQKPEDASKIREINTPDKNLSLDTHIETIPAALKNLKSSKADQQWLIVLTDGDEFYRDGQPLGKGDKTKEALEEELSKSAESVNTMYMGIGNVAVMPEIKGKYGHKAVEAKDSADVPAKLSDMCNTIFGRNQLPDSNVKNNGRKIDFDIPLSKLIVFVQGEGIKINSLKDNSGKTIPSKTVAETKFSEKGAEHYKSVQGVDTTLQGVMVTYEGLDKGSYTLDFEGTESSIDYYYEPNVDLAVDILDSDGISLFENGELYAGEHEITYKLTEPGKIESLESPLLGKTIYDIQFTKNGEVIPMTVADKAGAIPFTLAEGDVLGFEKAQVTFLNDYTISKTPDEIGFKSDGYTSVPRPAELKTTFKFEKDEFLLSELEEKGIYELPLVYNGEPMSAEQIAQTKVTTEVSGGEGEGNPIGAVSKIGDKILINLTYNEEQAAKTNTGDQEMFVKVEYTDEFGTNALGQFKADFTVIDDSKLVTVESINIKEGKKYYLLSELSKGAPVYFKIAVDGSPATDEELEAICSSPDNVILSADKNFDIDRNSLKPVKGQSQIEANILPKGTKTGRHGVKAQINVPNTRNQVYESEESKKSYIEINSIPTWLKWLIILAILLLLALLIFLILNMKILPRDIYIKQTDTEFISDGDEVTGFKQIRYGRKNIFGRLFSDTSLLISSIPDGGGQAISSVQLKIKRVSKVKEVLFERRRCKVEATLVNPSNTITDLSIGGVNFEYNEDAQGFLDDSEKPAKDHPVKLSEGSNIEINEASTGFRGTKYLSYTTNLHMKW